MIANLQTKFSAVFSRILEIFRGILNLYWHNSSGRTMALGVNSAPNINEYGKVRFHPVAGHMGPEGE
jgi:hypothetical protein